MTQIINCTPHDVNIVNEAGGLITFPKSGVVPRLKQETQTVGNLNGIPVTETVFGETQELPAPIEGVFLIVSRLVMSANQGRQDLLVPNDVVRDESGNIIGCRSFARN